MRTASRVFTIAKYSILEALRDRFLLLIIGSLVTALIFSAFIGELAITESTEMQTAFLAYILRLFSVFAMSLFVITSMLREFNDKGFELILSQPITRSSYFLGKFTGFTLIAFLLAIAVAACLLIYAPASSVFYWTISLFCELVVVVALSFFFLFTLNSITLSFSLVVAFYVLARSIEVIRLISDAPILDATALSHQFIDAVIEALAYVIPDMNSFTRTDWVVYGPGGTDDLLMVLGQTVIYTLLLCTATLFDLYKKEL